MKPSTDITLAVINSNLSPSAYSGKTAKLALRSYGMVEKAAQDLLLEEVDMARDTYGLAFDGYYSPMLIELFGQQNVLEALSYCYHFMAEYEISFDFYYSVLLKLLECFKSEELIAYPDKINMFLTNLRAPFSSKLSPEELEERMEDSLIKTSLENIQKMTLSRMDLESEEDNDEADNDD